MDNIIHILKYRRLIEILVKNPEKEYTIRRLSRLSSTSYATTWRVVKVLADIGGVKCKKAGKATLVSINSDSVIFNEIEKSLEIETFPLMAELKREFNFIKDRAKGVILYGSFAKGEEDGRSDIDLCIVGPKDRDVLRDVYRKTGDKYDVKVFENLPIYIQIDIIKNNKTVIGDDVGLSYYFYQFRKRWNDVAVRIKRYQHKSVRDMVSLRRAWLNERGKVSIKA